MKPVLDTQSMVKPAGGLWCTECQSVYDLPWMNYMLRKQKLFFMKSPKSNPFLQKGVLLNLKTGAKIFELVGEEGREILSSKYRMSYESLAEEYDGYYVNICDIFGRDRFEKEKNQRIYSVSSLVLFNLDCIEDYQKMMIEVDPFTYDDYSRIIDYDTKLDPFKHTIPPLSPEYIAILEMIISRFKDFIISERRKFPNVTAYQIAFCIYDKIKEIYGSEIEELCTKKGLDIDKFTYSLSSSAVSKVK
jgi:hypothetical protein